MGHDEKGGNGEVGSYVFSSRTSKIVKVYPVRNASSEEAVKSLKRYCIHILHFLQEKVNCIQTDAGTQFMSKTWGQVCAQHGLEHRTCPVDHQAMNGQVERVSGILAAKTRALLMDGRMNKKYWPLAIQAAAYLLNRTPHDSLEGISPLEKGTTRKPDLSRTRVFGCTAYVQIPKAKRRGKLSDMAWEGILVGYSTQSPEWIILAPRSGQLRNAYSVMFSEHESGFTTAENKGEDLMVENEGVPIVNLPHANGTKGTDITRKETPLEEQMQEEHTRDDGAPSGSEPCKETTIPVETESAAKNTEGKATEIEIGGQGSPTNSISSSDSRDENSDPSWEPDRVSKSVSQPNNFPRASARIRHTFNPNYMPSGTSEMEKLNELIENDLVSSEDEERDPPVGQNVEQTGVNLCMALTTNDTNLPRTWRQAINTPEWETAMINEINELKSKNAWELIPKPKGAKVLPGVWNFRIKRDENGNVIKYKARWCVDGSREGFLRPPENTFAPVAELPTVRAMIAIAAKDSQIILQTDFPNAYINAEIKEDIYVCQPKGLEEKDSNNYVCKLRKALYGCPISGKRWNETLKTAILSLGYRQSVIDHCLFHKEENGTRDLLLIYVDVLATSSAGTDRAEYMLDELSEMFEIKKLGKAKYVLGFGVHQRHDGTFLEQNAYIESILHEAGYLNARIRSTPWDNHLKEDASKLPPEEIVMFRRTLGQLAYLANATRPDITWAVARLASGIQEPTRGQWERVKRLLRYLSGTKGLGLKFIPCKELLKLETFVDSSFAVDSKKGRSVTGFIVYLNGGPVLWKSHLQSTVADSPNAAEYIALYESAVASMGLHNLVKESGMILEETCKIYEDNDGSRRLAMSGMGQKKARHLQTKHHYVQELCGTGKVKVLRIPTGDQPVDLLTKGSHTGKLHAYLLGRLGVVNQT